MREGTVGILDSLVAITKKGKKETKVLVVYYRRGCHSSIKTFRWLRKHDVHYKKCRVEQLSKEIFLSMLTLSENGVNEFLKSKGELSTQTKIKEILEMSFNQAIDYISDHTDVLRTPLIFSQNKLLIGYHDTEIRQFMPRKYRLLYRSECRK